MSDRPTNELVANLAVWAADAKPTTAEVEALAREVQASRNLIADLRTWLTRMDGGRCERTTGGGYYCLGDGYTPDAAYGVNRSCESCNANRAVRMIDEAGL